MSLVTLGTLLASKPSLELVVSQGAIRRTATLSGSAISARTWLNASQAALTSLHGLPRLSALGCRDAGKTGRALLDCVSSGPALRLGQLRSGTVEGNLSAQEAFRAGANQVFSIRWQLSEQRSHVAVAVVNVTTGVIVHETLATLGDVQQEWRGRITDEGDYALVFSSSGNARYAALIQGVSP